MTTDREDEPDFYPLNPPDLLSYSVRDNLTSG
jgi:hypothetical protein